MGGSGRVSLGAPGWNPPEPPGAPTQLPGFSTPAFPEEEGRALSEGRALGVPRAKS